ncbi:PH domain-containing protein [Ectobacillus antri]|jgi:membrane protein YdbS with pleckstrin-like domain|uniref:PH domain-containing protein n=1 Tax=Ectobacillus antri TaxID=2486280 RepID=A0ABT6H7D2_9BACI|nr:PH domain-containing protein [Ectobacillus antri]MDG4658156.1 PH domain-containing protein [Ectobacillus antri]MDG5755250.1 PH domain-containing protein [Ectobacillus antri]
MIEVFPLQSRLEHYIDERAVQVWRLTAIVINVVIVAIYGAVFLIFPSFRDMTMLHIGLGMTLFIHILFTIFIFPRLRWQRWRYAIQAQEIDLQHGVFITKKTLVPMIRVQHVDIRQGPFLRKYGLAAVEITTAATTHEIPAVAVEEAERLRNQLSALARVATEDV